MEGKVAVSLTNDAEVGDGASSRVYVGKMNCTDVAVKKLKGYSHSQASSFVKSYEKFLHMQNHPKIAKIYGLCPQSGYIIMELCEKNLGDEVVHTLEDLMVTYGSEMPLNLSLIALTDIIEGVEFLHSNGIIHGDIKPSNVLVTGLHHDEFIFKLTDYVSVPQSSQRSSHSTTMKQLMTPGYMAPELLSTDALSLRPNKASDIYAFAILAYELVCCKPAWCNVSMALIDNVRHGLRPAFPSNVDITLSGLIKECWLQDPEARPNAPAILKVLEDLFDVRQESEVHDCTDSDSHTDELDVDISGFDDNAYQSYEQSDETPNISSSPHNSQPSLTPCTLTELESLKSKLKVVQYKSFQVAAIEALQNGKDCIVVQPTGSGKSLCFVASALMNPSKITLVIEPMVAVITNQIENLKAKGIDAFALGSAAGKNNLVNFRKVFRNPSDGEMPLIAFCTPEYLFGTAANGRYPATIGQFSVLEGKADDLHLIVLDEAHKILDRLPSYRPAFDGIKRMKQLECKLLAMSATLTQDQVQILQADFLHSSNCVVLTEGVHRNNLVLHLRRYKRQKPLVLDDDGEIDAMDDIEGVSSDPLSTESSSWSSTAQGIMGVLESNVSVVFLDFVSDVEQMTQLLNKSKTSAMKYTGHMKFDDRVLVEKKFLKGDAAVLVATEAYELGVDNPRITQVIRIGCPRNLGVLLQEFGRAGRKEGMIANAFLYINECVDDKRLGLWLKAALDREKDGSDEDGAHEAKKQEMIHDYVETWRFVYSVYHGKCLCWALSSFYGGAGDTDPPTCFVSNSPLCMICKASDMLCQESCDIKDYLCMLLSTIQQLKDAGLNTVTKTLLVGVLMKTSSQYVDKCLESVDDDTIPWGCGMVIKDVPMSSLSWCKVLYVAVHLYLLDLSFTFRPFENHYEVHRRYMLSTKGEEYLANPTQVMSLNPSCTVIDRILASSQEITIEPKKSSQARGTQVKPRLMKIFETQAWQQGDVNELKFLGFDVSGTASTSSEICLYFPEAQNLPHATSDPHYLLHCLQLSRSQATIKELEVHLDGKRTTLLMNRSYCSGIKTCAGEGCDYTVSTKQKINRCEEHPAMALQPSGPCCCHIVYIYPKELNRDSRRWFVAMNTGTGNLMHNHAPPSEWKISPRVLADISNAVSHNLSVTPKELQKGVGMSYRPMEASLPAASLDRMRAAVKKVRKEVEKVDNDKVNPFKIIASFPAIKARIDKQCTVLESRSKEIDELIGSYQLDGNDAYQFTRDRRYAFFQSPFQLHHWSKADALFVDIDYTGNHHFPYLFNVVCLNNITKCYMACGRALMNHQDGESIGKALSVFSSNIKNAFPRYQMTSAHKEILLDFAEGEANAFRESFGMEINNLLRGCSVHFIRSAMRIAKIVNPSTHSLGYQIFMSVAKLIPDNPSKDKVKLAFSVLSGTESFTKLSESLPPPLCNVSLGEVDTVRWSRVQTWTDWWTRPAVLQKLSKAFSSIDADEWDELPGTNNPVESINRQSTPDNLKSVSLRPLVEHFYLEDRRQAVLQIASEAGVTISYKTKRQKRNRRPPKAPESRNALGVPSGKKAVGLRVAVEYYTDDQQSTRWYKGTVISYSSRGYVITFDGCGPDENETIKSLKQGVDKGEIKLL